ncbi:MAG TPA: SDR family oxidoreductase [Chromatiales bacterium]|nr:SDR family oxidoreductase [Chromatiales bacterium]
MTGYTSTMEKSMILLTGATGKSGGPAARELLKKGVAVRVLVRDASRAAALKEAGAELVVGDVADPEAVRNALNGCQKALLLLPNSEQQLELEKQFTDLAKSAGVQHLVKLSSMEAGAEATAPIPKLHWASEEHIRASGLAWTMIRPNFFMQNLLSNAPTIKSMRKFFLPMGKARTAMIDARDIGAVIAEALSGSGHEGQSYDITGPELLDFHEVAERFSEVLGTRIEYVDQPPEAYREMLSKFLTSEWHLNAVCELFEQIAAGGLERITDTFRQVTGREPISLTTFIGDYRDAFQPD